ncbi:cytosolic sulfotransferase 5 [Phtheirospermum japonicum]|uniref:Sulfotransferase n=1 Tax=Phtheirospermum japonicum TaxID=374723 RepID=A0A830BNU4_9LAMI|nr:cytosolic sulfotransferase 5 [Phtheirospermum japonicum]
MSTIPTLSHSLNPTNVEKLLKELPKACFWETRDLSQYDGFWFPSPFMKPIITFRSTFHARDDDVILASTMKTGTTWLKALSLCIMQKTHPTDDSHEHDDILTLGNPHFHVPTIEAMVYSDKDSQIDIYDPTTPRLLHTHLPYTVLPDSVKHSPCKIVYIARNPKDTLISSWHFFNSILRPNQDPLPLEKALDCFCSGVYQYGPFFDHVVEFWRESQKRPRKILFVKYEDMKSDPKGQVSKIAEFLGRPFADEEEVEDVLWRCSLKRLKNLEVNKSECHFSHIPNKTFFRKGDVGDWRNYLTNEMEEQINQISRIKLEPIGLFL